MLNKFFKFLRGYVIIAIYGSGAERFINICLRRGIQLWGTRPIDGGVELCIYMRDFFRIRPVVKKSKVTVHIKEKSGLRHFIKMHRSRYMLLVGMVMCIALFAVSTRFIWVVEINGVEQSDIESIISTLDRLGVKSGARKSRLPEGFDIKSEIINNTDNVAWAWVYIEGAKARVEIYEKTLPPTLIDRSAPCDIVAACDGVIGYIVVKNGEETVKAGDAVSAGDVIVSGKVAAYKEGKPEEYIYVHSMAQVQAYTSHTRSGDYKLYYESRIPTGKSKTHFSIELFGKLFHMPAGKIKYGDYSVTKKRRELCIPFFGYTGIAVSSEKYIEESVNKEQLSMETALEFAKNDLEEKIAKELTLGSQLRDEQIEYIKKDNETINVTLKMDFIENIAVEQPLALEKDEGEEIFDKQTDRGTAGN